MKQETKTKLTREKIINAAMQEFGTNGYEKASVNALCERHKISKGLIYHNFQSKDEVYLICVHKMFLELTEYIKNNLNHETTNPEIRLKSYLISRLSFFQNNHIFQKLYWDAMVFPPVHLVKQMDKIKNEFDCSNVLIIRELIEGLDLRTDICRQKIISSFCQSIDLLEPISWRNADEHLDEKEFLILDLLLYGIITR